MEFIYKAKDPSGKIVEGEMEASDKRIIADRLRNKRMIILNISEKKESALKDLLGKINPFKPKVKPKEIVIFSRQLATMVEAGIPVVNCLDALAEQAENKTLANTVMTVRDDVERGASLSQALSKHTKVFK